MTIIRGLNTLFNLLNRRLTNAGLLNHRWCIQSLKISFFAAFPLIEKKNKFFGLLLVDLTMCYSYLSLLSSYFKRA